MRNAAMAGNGVMRTDGHEIVQHLRERSLKRNVGRHSRASEQYGLAMLAALQKREGIRAIFFALGSKFVSPTRNTGMLHLAQEKMSLTLFLS